MITIDYRSRVPIYDQIVSGVIRLKSVGVLKGDDKLWSVRKLANELHINPNTVQRAYTILENEGIIYSISGKGSFISNDCAVENALRLAAENDFKKAVDESLKRGLLKSDLLKLLDEADM